MRKDILPEKEYESCFGEQYGHPAFGVIEMVHVMGGNNVLFGSSVTHPGTVSITIKTASLIKDHGRERHSSAGGEVLIGFEMSHAQFVDFVSSPGRGSGIPVTLRTVRKGAVEHPPGIKMVDSFVESTRRSIEQNVLDQIEQMTEQLEAIEAHLDSGKLSKKELRGRIATMKCMFGNLPVNLGYSIERAKETVENIATSAKVDVEAFLAGRIRSLGIKSIEALASPEDSSNERPSLPGGD